MQKNIETEEILNDALKEMKALREIILPILKENSMFSMSEMRDTMTLFYSAGAYITTLRNIADDESQSFVHRARAEAIIGEFSDLCDEACNVVDC